MKEKNKLMLSIIFNFMIIIFTAFASFLMFTGIKIMHGAEIILESTKLGMFKFFTVDSNIFMGCISLIFLIYEIKLLKGKIKEISTWVYILKLMATSSVSLTFFVVVSYLGPISPGGVIALLKNSNLFFHLLIPVFSIITFILFEKTQRLKFNKVFWTLIPTFCYALFYLMNILLHLEEGKVSTIYDFYWFVQNGIYSIFIVFPIMLLITLIISIILWYLNRFKIRND